MTEKPDLPVFPFVPDKITKSHFRAIEKSDITSEEDLQQLVDLLWKEPDTHCYYYFPTTEPAGEILLAAEMFGQIHLREMERHYYRHPTGGDRDFVQIAQPAAEYRWEWQREVVEKGPEFWRVTLTLSSRGRAELDAAYKVELEEQYREARRRSEYQFDIFLSYASEDTAEAELIHSKATASGLRLFMAPKILAPGDDFAEKIRSALEGARELWLLVSPNSVHSEWVISEWGAAWVLKRTIVPILHRCAPDALPDRLRRLHCIDLHRCEELVLNRANTRA